MARIAYWPLSTDAKDYSGSGFNGTAEGSLAFGGAGGPGGRAYATFVPATDDYVDLPSVGSINFQNGFSFAAWLRSGCSSTEKVLELLDADSKSQIQVGRSSGGKLTLYFRDKSAALLTAASSTALATDNSTWQHWICTVPAPVPSGAASGSLFNGATGLYRATSDSLKTLGDTGSMLCRFYLGANIATQTFVKAGTGYSPTFMVHGDTHKVRAWVNSAGASAERCDSSKALSTETWYDCFISWVRAEGTTTITIKVCEVGGSDTSNTDTSTDTPDTWDYDCYIGAQASVVAPMSAGGKLRDVMLLSRVISDEEWTAYKAGTLPTAGGSVVANWQLGTDFTDASGNGNDMLTQGKAIWYLNGAADTTGTAGKLPLTVARTDGRIGRLVGGSGEYTGGVQGLRLYTHCLSATEISNLYNSDYDTAITAALVAKLGVKAAALDEYIAASAELLVAKLGVKALLASHAERTEALLAAVGVKADLVSHSERTDSVLAKLGVKAALTAQLSHIQTLVAKLGVKAAMKSLYYDPDASYPTTTVDRWGISGKVDREDMTLAIDREDMTVTVDREN